MIDKMPVIQMDCSQQASKLLVNGKLYTIVTRGFLVKHQLVLGADKRAWFAVRKRGANAYRLQFANGRKYQLEVLSYTTTAYVFYDQEDTEICRLTPSPHSADSISLLVSVASIPDEEFIGLVAWGFYFWRTAKEKAASYKYAA